MKTFEQFIQKQNIMKIPKDILEIADKFYHANKEIYLVGGCVRDFILGKTPHDFDLTTNALPNEIKNILKDYRTDLQGEHFGVVRVFTEETPLGVEIASYRKDISSGRDTKGTEQKVELGQHITLSEDLSRRDLTQNGLVYDIKNQKVIDLVGGVEDIKNKIIRTIGNPSDRFKEDKLRILRVFRFSARSGFKIDEETSKAIHNDNRLRGIGPKDDVSQERIVEEFLKMLDSAKSSNSPEMFQKYLILLSEYDMWKQMFPGLKFNDVKEESLKYDSLQLPVILANLLSDNDIKGIANKLVLLKFSTDVANKVQFLMTFKKDYLDDEKVYDLLILKQRCNLSDEILKEFGYCTLLKPEKVEQFLKYSKLGITTSGTDLESEGFKGKELGDEKKRREILIYKDIK